MELSLVPSTFSEKFIGFPESTLNFEYFETKIILIASICQKLLLPKLLQWARTLVSEHRFEMSLLRY